MIGIVNYGAGNIKSVINAFEFIGKKAELVSDADKLKDYHSLVLPGVGAFSEAMSRLKSLNLDDAIRDFISSNKPFLGICLGMQLLFDKSYEFGQTDGLGIIKGSVVKFDSSKFKTSLKIPHVGWNTMRFTTQMPINKGLDELSYFYFVHSYHVVCNECVLGVSEYGYEFVSAVCRDNVFGFQPHPEKSYKTGLQILKNFTEL